MGYRVRETPGGRWFKSVRAHEFCDERRRGANSKSSQIPVPPAATTNTMSIPETVTTALREQTPNPSHWDERRSLPATSVGEDPFDDLQLFVLRNVVCVDTGMDNLVREFRIEDGLRVDGFLIAFERSHPSIQRFDLGS